MRNKKAKALRNLARANSIAMPNVEYNRGLFYRTEWIKYISDEKKGYFGYRARIIQDDKTKIVHVLKNGMKVQDMSIHMGKCTRLIYKAYKQSNKMTNNVTSASI